jgi:hypothetical protein
LTSKELYDEGEAMQHCVGSYVRSCKSHQIAIFSLRKVDENGVHREATISVNIRERKIKEARKSCNRLLTQSDWGYIREWANINNLKFSSWLQ